MEPKLESQNENQGEVIVDNQLDHKKIIEAIQSGHNTYSKLLQHLNYSPTSLKSRLRRLNKSKDIGTYRSEDGKPIYYTKKQWWNKYFMNKVPSRRLQSFMIAGLTFTAIFLALTISFTLRLLY